MLRKWTRMLAAMALALVMCWTQALAASEPEPTLGTEPSDADQLDQMLFELAREAEDPWVKAILQAGCGAADMAGGTAALRSFNPRLGELPGYDKDPAGWLSAFRENIAAFDLSVPVELEGDALSKSGEKALLAAVKKAAGTAKSAFDQKQVRVAVADWLLPRPLESLKSASDLEAANAFNERFSDLVTEALFEPGEQKWYAPLMYAQSKQSLSVKDGPHQLVLTIWGADPAAFAESAKAAALAELSRLNVEERDDVEGVLLDALVSQAISLSGEGGSEQKFVLDIDTLFDGEYGDEYADYIASYRPASLRDTLRDDANALPDYPSEDFPKTGRISGSKSGTQINIKAPKDELGRYVQMRDADTGEMSVDMFIRSGQTCTVRVPKGMYYFTVATGSTWYGIDGLFGPTGRLSKTEDMEVLSSKYYHDIQLQVSTGGNMSTYGASAADFAR